MFFCFLLSESWEEIPAILLFEISESKGHVNLKVPRQQKIIEHLVSASMVSSMLDAFSKRKVLSAARKLTNTVSRPNASGSVIETSGVFLRINRNLYGNEAWNMKSPKGGDFQGVRLWINFTSQKLQKLKVLSKEVAKLSEGCCFRHRIDWELQLRVAGI